MRLGEQETLTDADLFQLQSLTLLGVFDARSDDLELALLRQVDERVHEFSAFGRVGEGRHEMPIEFHDRDRQLRQVTQERLAGLEVVDR